MKTRLRAPMVCFILAAIHTPLFATATLTLEVPASGVIATPNPLAASFDTDSPYYSILSNSTLAQPTQGYGTYTDFVGQDFIVLGPESNFDLRLGGYLFNPGVLRGTEITGVTISLFYTLYTADPNSPNFDPIDDYVSNDEVSVSNLTLEDEQADAAAPMPEPGSWALAALGLVLVGCSLARKTE